MRTPVAADELLPRWTEDETWGRNYWDWEDPVQAENVTEFVVRYLIEHPDIFPNWKNDARNLLSLFLNRTSVCPGSAGDVFSGAWAYPESSSAAGARCGMAPELAPVWRNTARSRTARGPRRLPVDRPFSPPTTAMKMAWWRTYRRRPGRAGGWFKIAHPMALKHVLNAMA